MKCPMCNIELSMQRICPQCGREWLSQNINGEDVIISKPRVVELIDNLEEGKILDDCIKSVPVHTFTFSIHNVEGIGDKKVTFSTRKELKKICPPLAGINTKDLNHMLAMKIIIDDPCTIIIKRDDYKGDL